jgi:hypothetical protein
MKIRDVRYVNSGGVHIAYRVFGDGPLDLVLVPAFTGSTPRSVESDLAALRSGESAT